MSDSRTSNSIKNSITAVIANIVTIIVAFISRTVFIKILGPEYLGVDGLFGNVLMMLNFFELGIGSSIVYNMYKPIAEQDVEKIKSLLLFYKKTYNLIAIVVFILGIMILPFISFFVGELKVDLNVYLVFFLLLLNTVNSYILVYKRNLLYANQKNYIINIVHTIYIIILNIIQISLLYIFKNYYIYLGIKIICQFFENIIISSICTHIYSYTKEPANKLEDSVKKSIFSKVKALIFHKIGSIAIYGTDNLIISKFIGVLYVGLYSNYFLIIDNIGKIFGQTISSITSSVGNLLAVSDQKKNFEVFKTTRFINFWISTFTAISLLVMIEPFIILWIGKEFLLSKFTLILLIFNYFQSTQRLSYATFKDSGGIWEKDKYVPLIEASLNIVFSIIFVRMIGLPGVFLGTIISGLSLWCYSYPKLVYKSLFGRSYIQYLKETLGYVLLFIFMASLSYIICDFITFDSNLVQLLFNGFIALCLPNIVIILLFFKTDEFKSFLSIINRILKKIKKVLEVI